MLPFRSVRGWGGRRFRDKGHGLERHALIDIPLDADGEAASGKMKKRGNIVRPHQAGNALFFSAPASVSSLGR